MINENRIKDYFGVKFGFIVNNIKIEFLKNSVYCYVFFKNSKMISIINKDLISNKIRISYI